MAPSIQHLKNEHRFQYEQDELIAYLEYSLDGTIMTIRHTWVPKALGGQGIAAQLTRCALETAEQQQWQVVPACSYAERYIEKHQQYQKLLAH